MASAIENREEIREYLLGSLSEDARQRVEERLLTEDTVFEELLVCEDELFDDYVAGALSADERSKFEAHFLSTPERQQKLRFALALNRYAANQKEKAESGSAKAQVPVPVKATWAERLRAFWNSQAVPLRAAAAMAVVALILSAGWLFLRPPSSPRTFATLTLNPGVSNRAEGAQASKVRLPPDADALKISLILPKPVAPAASYRVELVNDRGAIESVEIAGQDAATVAVVIPAARLARGRYALKLFMTTADGTEHRINDSYYFTVE